MEDLKPGWLKLWIALCLMICTVVSIAILSYHVKQIKMAELGFQETKPPSHETLWKKVK